MNPKPQGPEENRYAERFTVSDRIARRYGLKRRFQKSRGQIRRPQDSLISPGMEDYYAGLPRSRKGELNRRRRRPERSSYKPEEMNWERFAEMVRPK